RDKFLKASGGQGPLPKDPKARCGRHCGASSRRCGCVSVRLAAQLRCSRMRASVAARASEFCRHMSDDLPAHLRPARSFQGLILALQRYWADYGCVILQPYDMEVGAGTFHPATTLRALG